MPVDAWRSPMPCTSAAACTCTTATVRKKATPIAGKGAGLDGLFDGSF
jgi:hypothetical protein